jgi:TfoX/Sxy family transcriptional regulator of competence genes
MGSTKECMDYLLERLEALQGVYARKMFGEYGIYFRDKVVAMLCDDQLFVKPTDAGIAFLKDPEYAPPYPGAREYILIPEDSWDDSLWLCELIRISEPEIKLPKKKKPKAANK